MVARPHPQMREERLLFRKRKISKEAGLQALSVLVLSGHDAFFNARSVFSRLCFSTLGCGGKAH